MFAPGTLVGGRYRLVRILGQGGMGEVWEGVQVPLARRVAVKTILSELAAEPSLLARFRREAETAAALGHPNIVQVTDFVEGEPPLIVMELLEGETLKAVIEREGRLDPGRAAFIGGQMLSGLAAAHGANIIHRDVKPANTFLQSTLAMRDIVKIVDFGLAKLVMEAAPATVPIVTRLGQVLGTLSYMAPEQASGESIDHRADIYAVGATLFHAICGVKPFDVIELGKPRARLVEIAPWVDRRLGDAIDRALASRPEDRWASAAQMAEAIAPFAARTSLPGTAADGPKTRPSALAVPTPMMNPTVGVTVGSSPTGPAGPTSPTGPSALAAHAQHAYAPTVSTAPATVPASGPATPSFTPPPPVYGSYYPPPPPMYPQRPMGPTPPRTGMSGAIIAAIAALVALPFLFYFGWIVAVQRRASGSVQDAMVQAEQRFLATAKLPRCPAPDRCTESLSDHDVTYPLCTNKTPKLNPFKQSEFLVVRHGGKPELVLVDSPGHVRAIMDSSEFDLDEAAVVGRVCSAGGTVAPDVQ
jgi:serine/threonine protein kinase